MPRYMSNYLSHSSRRKTKLISPSLVLYLSRGRKVGGRALLIKTQTLKANKMAYERRIQALLQGGDS